MSHPNDYLFLSPAGETGTYRWWSALAKAAGITVPAITCRSKGFHKADIHPPSGGVDASWLDSYDATGFVGIFSSGS